MDEYECSLGRKKIWIQDSLLFSLYPQRFIVHHVSKERASRRKEHLNVHVHVCSYYSVWLSEIEYFLFETGGALGRESWQLERKEMKEKNKKIRYDKEATFFPQARKCMTRPRVFKLLKNDKTSIKYLVALRLMDN